MSYVGDFNLGDTFDVKFTTRQISGAPFTLAGSPVISAYVGNSTTEITAGITLSVDFDSRTGLNNVRVVATGGNGYATASNYQLVITTGTVNSVSVVGEVVAEFSIEARSAGLKPTVAGRTVVVDAAGLIDANAVKLGPTGAGTAQTARDIGASVLLSAGSGAGQLDFTSGVVKANATQWLGGTIPAVNVAGVPLVDLKYTLGTISPATAGSVRADAVTGAVGSVTAGVTVTTNNDKSAYTLSAAYDAAKTASQAGDAMALTGGERTSLAGVINTTAIVESYRANGAAPTHAQFMSEVLAHLGESSISGTTKTTKKFDHSTTAETFTLDSAVTPAAITRAT